MANNRIEAVSQVNTDLVPTIVAPVLRNTLNTDIIESIVFRKDVIGTETPAGSAVTVDFSNKDLATFTAGGNLAISFTGMQNGDVKFIEVTKNAGNSITFPGSSDISPRRANINSSSGVVVYRVINKNNVIYVCSINSDFDFKPDIDALDTDLQGQINNLTALNPDGVQTVKLNIGSWNISDVTTVNVSYAVPPGLAFAISDVLIQNDFEDVFYKSLIHSGYDASTPINGVINYQDATTIQLARIVTGYFYNRVDYNSTSINRGWIIGNLFAI